MEVLVGKALINDPFSSQPRLMTPEGKPPFPHHLLCQAQLLASARQEALNQQGLSSEVRPVTQKGGNW